MYLVQFVTVPSSPFSVYLYWDIYSSKIFHSNTLILFSALLKTAEDSKPYSKTRLINVLYSFKLSVDSGVVRPQLLSKFKIVCIG